MQLLRFQNQNIYVIEKTVEYCGKNIAKSKKRVKWIVKHGQDLHFIDSSLSFYSGKKKALHNGRTIMDIIDSSESLNFLLIFGKIRMIFMVDEHMQQATLQRRYPEESEDFINFKNMYSQPITKIYESFYSQE